MIQFVCTFKANPHPHFLDIVKEEIIILYSFKYSICTTCFDI